jgi:hypothetical protein
MSLLVTISVTSYGIENHFIEKKKRAGTKQMASARVYTHFQTYKQHVNLHT